MKWYYRYILIILLLFVSCNNKEEIKCYSAIYIGDSLCFCTSGQNAAKITGIDFDCLLGRKSIEYGELPFGYDMIFYALGTNDAYGEIDINEFKNDLENKINNSTSIIYCVLPMIEIDGFNTRPYRNVMIEVCEEIIDPSDYGVVMGAGDGVHWSDEDQISMSIAIKERICQ